MTEEDWLIATEPTTMLYFLRASGKLSDRKARLFAVACCRRIWGFLLDGRSREAVEIGERYADGLTDPDELKEAWDGAMAAASVLGHDPAWAAVSVAHATDPSGAAQKAATAMVPGVKPVWEATKAPEFREELGAQCDLLRDLFGPLPFRSLTLDPSWRTPTVLALAESIYDGRSFDRLPVLADALAEVGCTDPEILDHCRSAGPHVKGCWAVDLLTGQT